MAGYEELAGGLRPIRNGEIFWMITEIEWTNQNARNALEGRREYSLWRAIREGSARKGYLFQASGIWKSWDFTSWIIIWVCERAPLTDEFYSFIKSTKRSIFVIDYYLNDRAFIAVKMDSKFSTRCEKDVPFVNRSYTKGVPFSWKNGV